MNAQLPWEYRPQGSDGGLGSCFCQVGQPREYGRIDLDANAGFIVSAVNNIERLAGAAAYVLKAYDNGYDDNEVELTMVGLREALAEWSKAQ